MHFARDIPIAPHGNVAVVSQIASRHLCGRLEQPPRPDLKAALLVAPVVENDLVENEPPMLVVEVIDLDQVDLIPHDIIDGI